MAYCLPSFKKKENAKHGQGPGQRRETKARLGKKKLLSFLTLWVSGIVRHLRTLYYIKKKGEDININVLIYRNIKKLNSKQA